MQIPHNQFHFPRIAARIRPSAGRITHPGSPAVPDLLTDSHNSSRYSDVAMGCTPVQMPRADPNLPQESRSASPYADRANSPSRRPLCWHIQFAGRENGCCPHSGLKSIFEPHRISHFAGPATMLPFPVKKVLCQRYRFSILVGGQSDKRQMSARNPARKMQNCEKGYRGYAHLF